MSERRAAVPALLAVLVLTLPLAACGPKPRYRATPIDSRGRMAPTMPVAPGPVDRDTVEAVARPWLGTPYRYGGVDDRGVDCSGLAQNVLGQLGVALPRTVRAQSRVGTVVPLREMAPGDLLVFRLGSSRPDHVGIALDANRFVHASSSRGVVVDRIMDDYFARRLVEVRRVLGEEGKGDDR